MAEISRSDILDALRAVIDPDQPPGEGKDIVTLGMVTGLVVKGGNVGFALDVGSADGRAKEPLRRAAEDAIRAIPGVLSATVVLTAERSGQNGSGQENAPQEGHGAGHGHGRSTGSEVPPAEAVPGVKSIIAVASGKGGVGKSTVAVNLAIAMQQAGLNVGLLDADVYGPSIPRMMGVNARPEADGDKVRPLTAFGIQLMSMGFLVDEAQPMIWRGPMVAGAVLQMFKDISWDRAGELDVLVVDMPPGTGDAQLTLAQRVPVAGAVIVSTPQDIALIDARKGLEMFRKVDVPVFGIVENMSMFICPHCGERSDIFGHGGAKKTSAQLSTAFLGEIPLELSIREAGDAGTPIVAAQPDSEMAKAFKAVAEKVMEKLGVDAG